MRFHVLGSLDVVDSGGAASIPLGGPQQRRLLAVLLVHRGHWLSTERLSALVWDDDTPRDPHGALRQVLARLRRALATLEGVTVERSERGIRLDVADDDLDATWFEHELRRAPGVADPAERLRILEAVLGLWRGEPYEEFAGCPFAEAEIARLAELRDEAVEQRIATLLELGCHREAIADIEAALVTTPYREALHGQLALAMYRSGRQLEALRHLTAFRVQLLDEVGLECGAELRHLEDAILLQKSELDWTAPGELPTPRAAPSPRPAQQIALPSDADGIDAWIRAGDRAAASPETRRVAIRCYTEALRLDDLDDDGLDERRRCDVLIDLGRLLRRDGDPRHREVLFESTDLAASIGDDDRRVRAVLANQNSVMASDLDVGDPERVERLCATLAVLGDEVTPRRARLLANLSAELTPTAPVEQRMRVSDEALALARTIEDPRVLAHVLRQRFSALDDLRAHAQRRDAAVEYAAVCRDLGDPQAADNAAWQLVQVAALAGDLGALDDAFASYERSGLIWSEQPFFRWNVNVHRSWRRALSGRLDEASALAAETRALGRRVGIGGSEWIYRIQRNTFRFESGDLAYPAPTDRDERPGCPPGRAAAILGLLTAGQRDEAAHLLGLAAGTDFADCRGGLVELACFAEGAMLLRHRDAASSLLGLLAPFHDLMAYSAIVITCPVHHWLGCCLVVLDRPVEAEEHFEQALAMEQDLRAPAMIVRTTIELARLAAARGDLTGATQRLDDAAQLARTWGLDGLLARATAERGRLDVDE